MKKCWRVVLKFLLIVALPWTQQRVVSAQELEAATLSQVPATTPILIGDGARQLSNQDMVDIGRILPVGAKPWILIGDLRGQSLVQTIGVYLPQETTTREIRRGSAISLHRFMMNSAWELDVKFRQSYAQVAIAGRNFDEIRGDQDINQPFLVDGHFDDIELMTLVTYIRSIRDVPNGPLRASIGSVPIGLLVRQPDESVVVQFRLQMGIGRTMVLRQQGQAWVMVSIRGWQR